MKITIDKKLVKSLIKIFKAYKISYNIYKIGKMGITFKVIHDMNLINEIQFIENISDKLDSVSIEF